MVNCLKSQSESADDWMAVGRTNSSARASPGEMNRIRQTKNSWNRFTGRFFWNWIRLIYSTIREMEPKTCIAGMTKLNGCDLLLGESSLLTGSAFSAESRAASENVNEIL